MCEREDTSLARHTQEVEVKVKVSAVAVVLAATAGAAHAAKPTCANPVGMWENPVKSVLVISKVDASSKLASGCYCSPSGTASEWFDLIGWVQDEAAPSKQEAVASLEKDEADSLEKGEKEKAGPVSWTFRWGPYGSITSWSGSCRNPGKMPTMTTLWHLVNPNERSPSVHPTADTDTFTPTSETNCGTIPPKCQVK
jgi:hypothetical protein